MPHASANAKSALFRCVRVPDLHETSMSRIASWHFAFEGRSAICKRWLTAPMEHADGMKAERARGTPQGGVVSPILANLFLHYTFDLWMTRMHPDLPWCRYADDGLVHCRNEQEAL